MKDWKLKLRYGKLKTPFTHYTILAPVLIKEYNEQHSAQEGKAYMGMKIWAEDNENAFSIFQRVANEAQFEITGNMELYETDPVEPPSEREYFYGINFSYYKD